MEIMKSEEVRELSDRSAVEYEKSVLEGPLFKSVLSDMEEAALQGLSGFTKYIKREEIRACKVIQRAFADASYDCELKLKVGLQQGTLFGVPYHIQQFIVSWEQK